MEFNSGFKGLILCS